MARSPDGIVEAPARQPARTIALSAALAIVEVACAKAAEIGVPMNVAVVDDGNNLPPPRRSSATRKKSSSRARTSTSSIRPTGIAPRRRQTPSLGES